MKSIVTAETIERKIYLIRGQKVMLDSDLAELYGVETRVLNQAVKRNINRFPSDFLFQLSTDEDKALRSQIVILEKTSEHGRVLSENESLRPHFATLKQGRGRYRKYLPYAFTEHGFAYVDDGCDGFCPKCERKIRCEVYPELKDGWERII